MNKTLKNLLLGSLLGAGTIASAHAGLLTYQDVTFTSTWSGNVLTLEIDAARHTGDWTNASGLAALELKGIGNYTGVSVTTAPDGAGKWTTSGSELKAGGCSGTTNGQGGSRLCFYGQQIALADNMVFSFTFSGSDIQTADPHLKVNFVDAKGKKTGSLLSQTLPASPAASTGGTAGTGTQSGNGASTVPAAPAAPAVPASPPATSADTGAPAAIETPVFTDTGTGSAANSPVEIPAQDILPSAGLPPAAPTGDAGAPLEAGNQPASEAGDAGPAAVPEPQSIALLLGGLGMMGLVARRKRRA